MPSDLPTPDSNALAHSARVVEQVRARIEENAGWLAFADFMELVLYEPGLGYYSAGARKFGESGDFITAPELSPLFSRCLAQQCMAVLDQLRGGNLLELGAGSGQMAADMLLEFERLGQLPDEYMILERGADLRERQEATLRERCPHLVDRVRWLDTGPAAFSGVIVGNEVIDALPVNLFQTSADGLLEAGVVSDTEGLALEYRPASKALLSATASIPAFADLPEGYSAECSLQVPGFIAEMTSWLSEGLILLLDYGFSRREYYAADRSSGTLQCYYRHRVHDDPLLWPGLQDITAWVDFTLLAEAAVDAGLDVSGYTTQAHFLLASGLESMVADAAKNDPQQQVEQAHALRQLLMPGEMGEAVKAIALTKGQLSAPEGFTGRDMRSSL